MVAAATLSPAPARAEPARRVYVGVYLHDVTSFDQRSGTYDVDLDVWAKWRGDFDASQIRIQNDAGTSDREDLGEVADEDWHSHRFRLRGTLRGEFPLHRFPFDTQDLPVVFELAGGSAELVPDLAGSGMAERFSITGWEYEPHFDPDVAKVAYPSDLGTIENEGRSTRVDRVHFAVTLRRPTVTIAVKLFLPLALLLLISLIAFFLGPELVDPRVSLGVTVLLACFAFQFTIAGTIPDVAYLTIVDALFILAYALTAIALVCTVVVYWLHRGGRERLAIWLDRLARVALPALAVAATWALLPEPPPPAEARVEPIARPERPESARSVVRVGTLSLAAPTGGVLRGMLRAGLVEIAESGERRAFLAEEAPSVSNDTLLFHASGELEVRFRLREGLRWSDGHPLTSDDFRFALEVSPDPHVVAVSTPDPRTLVLTYDDALAAALDGFAPLPRHVLGQLAEEGGYEAVREARRSRPLPGTGPYRIVEFVAGERLVAEANPHYVGAPPAIARVEIRAFGDPDAMAGAFEAGEIDVISPNVLSLEQAAAIEARAPGAIARRASEELIALSPDLGVPALAKIEVRRAILRAVDRAALAREVFGEFGFLAETPAVGLAPGDDERVGFDPEGARAVLEREGLVGPPLALSYTDRPVDARIAAAVAARLEAVGVRVERRALPPGQGRSRTRDHGGLLLVTMRSDDESDPRRYWNLARREGRFDPAARNVAYDDATADTVRRWERALYVERRAQLRDRLALGVARRLPVLPLMFAPEIVAVSPALEGTDGGSRFGDTLLDWRFDEPPATPLPAATATPEAPGAEPAAL